jgi:hypothetical protein
MSKDKVAPVVTDLPTVYFNQVTIQADKDMVRFTFFDIDGEVTKPRASVVTTREGGVLIRDLLTQLLKDGAARCH